MPPGPALKPTCRDQLLDAAEEVILRTGLGSLTLDAVAAHAKVSKGGLLYHFPSKDALIVAMVERTCNNWRNDYVAAIAAEPPGKGRVPRALLKMCMGSQESCSETCRRSSIVLVAAIATNPALAEPLRRAHTDLLVRLREEGDDTGAGEAVVLALNGLWFEQVFGLRDMPPARLNSIREALSRLVNGVDAGAPRANGRTRPAAAKVAKAIKPAAKRKQGIKP